MPITLEAVLLRYKTEIENESNVNALFEELSKKLVLMYQDSPPKITLSSSEKSVSEAATQPLSLSSTSATEKDTSPSFTRKSFTRISSSLHEISQTFSGLFTPPKRNEPILPITEKLLPLERAEFDRIPLSKEQREQALLLYYHHATHSAIRYLIQPNAWKAPNGIILDVTALKEHKKHMVLFYLAALENEENQAYPLSLIVVKLAQLCRFNNDKTQKTSEEDKSSFLLIDLMDVCFAEIVLPTSPFVRCPPNTPASMTSPSQSTLLSQIYSTAHSLFIPTFFQHQEVNKSSSIESYYSLDEPIKYLLIITPALHDFQLISMTSRNTMPKEKIYVAIDPENRNVHFNTHLCCGVISENELNEHFEPEKVNEFFNDVSGKKIEAYQNKILTILYDRKCITDYIDHNDLRSSFDNTVCMKMKSMRENSIVLSSNNQNGNVRVFSPEI